MKVRRAELKNGGGMRFLARTATGRELVFGDARELNEHSPMELVTTALAACSAMDVASILVKKRQVVDSYVVRVEGVQRDEYPQVLARVDVVHEVVGPDVTEEAVRRCIELSATKYCPVNAMISAGATEVHHRYVVRCTGPVPVEASGEVIVTGPARAPAILAD